MTVHLAPNTPWPAVAIAVLALAALAVWAYRFAIPPLPAVARRLLPLLRALGLVAVVLLFAQPVLERTLTGGATVVVLADRSASMRLPVAPGGESRAAAAARAVAGIERAFRGRAHVVTLPFAERLAGDSLQAGNPAVTALGDALGAVPDAAPAANAGAVVVVSDGATNAGADPVDAARRLGLPVHTLLTGTASAPDRAITDVEAPAAAQVGRAVPVRVHVVTTEPRGVPLPVTLSDGSRELARTTVVSPGPGAEAVAELHATPVQAGLAVWTARVDSLKGEITVTNDARQLAFPVAPGRLPVVLVSPGLNWDYAYLRRAIAGDSTLELRPFVKESAGWRGPSGARAPGEADLARAAVVVLDGVAPSDVSPAFDQALAGFLERGGGVLAFGGASPGLARLRGGRVGQRLGVQVQAMAPRQGIAPAPAAEARELLMWDDDPARGERAWRDAAPLADVMPLAPGAGDRVLVAAQGGGAPLLVARHGGRGQALLVNGTGTWRWSLSGDDELTAERARRLWRGLVHWLAEPVQGEPLRVRPERWLTAGGEPVRLLATLQDDAFRPVAGGTVDAQVTGPDGRARTVRFVAGAAGSYTAALDGLAPGRYRVAATASRAGRSLGRSSAEFAVDRWSLEEARALPDSATLAAVAQATGGRMGHATDLAAWSRGLRAAGAVRTRSTAVRLWESPYVFAAIVGLLSLEWIWRRRRGLP